MSLNTKIKDDSSRAISTLLLHILDSCRRGDSNIASEIGLEIDSLRLLESLKPDQINALSTGYLRETSAMQIFNLDPKKLSNMIKAAAADSETYDLCDEFLRMGASKKMMLNLFGMRSTQVANRKKFLNIPSVYGRMASATTEEERSVYDSWLASIKTSDFRVRLLRVAKETNIPLTKVHSVVDVIEKGVINSQQRHCA